MMIYAKLSTAITIPFGPVLDSAGAEYTGAVVGEVKISKNNGTPAALNGSATLTHKEVGIYELVLTTSDISAVGQVTLTLSKTTYIAPPITLIVLPAKVYDSLVGGTDNLEVDTIQWLGTAAETPTTAGRPNVNVKSINDIAATSVTTIGAYLGGTAAHAIQSDLALVKTATNTGVAPGASGGILISGTNSGTFSVTTNAIPWNAAWDAEVQSECNDALVVNGLDHLIYAQGTAYASTSTTFSTVDSIGATYILGSRVSFVSGTGAGQTRTITGFDSVETYTVDRAWTTNPANGDLFVVASDNVPALNSSLKVTGVVLTDTVTTYTGNTVQTGDSYAIVNSGTHGNAAIKGYVDDIGVAGAGLTDLGGMSTTMKGQVNTEVVDCLNVDTYAEIGQETPAATNTIRKMLAFLFKAWRNKKTQDASSQKIYNDAGTVVDQKATVSSDGTTVTVEEMGTGP